MGKQEHRGFARATAAKPVKVPAFGQEHLCGLLFKHLAAIYLVVALLLTGSLAVLTPPFGAPDEMQHILRALQIAHGGLLPSRTPQGGGGLTDPALLQTAIYFRDLHGQIELRYPIAHLRPSPRIALSAFEPMRNAHWSHHLELAVFPNTAVYPPSFYLPQALGWRLGEALDLSILHTLLLARLFAAFASVILGWLALRAAPAGLRAPLFGYLLLPTILALNGSCSQDALLLPSAALAFALLGRSIPFATQTPPWPLLCAALLIALCASARLPYLLLAPLLLLPALEASADKRRAWFWSGTAAACSALLILGWALAIRSFAAPVGPDANPKLQIAFVEQHPVRAASTLLLSLVEGTPALAAKAVAILGLNDVMPPLEVIGLIILVLIALLLSGSAPGLRRWPSKALVLLSLLSAVAGITVAEYLIWTAPGARAVAGLQPRYFLPLVPFALLFVVPARAVLGCRVRAGATVSLLALVCTIPAVAAHTFYGAGVLASLQARLR